MAILRVRDAQGNILEIPCIKGDKGEKGDPYIITDSDKTEIAESVKNMLGNIYTFKGSIATYQDLEELTFPNVKEGDVYNVLATGMNYAFCKEPDSENTYFWDALGMTLNIAIDNTLEGNETSTNPIASKAVNIALNQRIEKLPENTDLNEQFNETQKLWLLTGTEVNGPNHFIDGGLLINGIFSNSDTVQSYSQTIIANGMVHYRAILHDLLTNTSTITSWKDIILQLSTFQIVTEDSITNFQENATNDTMPSTLAMVNYVQAMIEQYDNDVMALLGTD